MCYSNFFSEKEKENIIKNKKRQNKNGYFL